MSESASPSIYLWTAYKHDKVICYCVFIFEWWKVTCTYEWILYLTDSYNKITKCDTASSNYVWLRNISSRLEHTKSLSMLTFIKCCENYSLINQFKNWRQKTLRLYKVNLYYLMENQLIHVLNMLHFQYVWLSWKRYKSSKAVISVKILQWMFWCIFYWCRNKFWWRCGTSVYSFSSLWRYKFSLFSRAYIIWEL